MRRVTLRETTPVLPFGEPARELRIMNKPLWLLQRDVLARYCKGTLDIDTLDDLPARPDDELLVYRDNLYFNADLIDTFVSEARAQGRACQIAFSRNDRAITAHALRLQEGIRLQGDVYVADLFYYPAGTRQDPEPLVIDTQPYEMGYYHIPTMMAPDQGQLVFQVPNRVFLSIENWVHIYIANTPMGVFTWARQNDEKMQRARLANVLHWTKEDRRALWPKLELVTTAFWERINPFEEAWRNHFLSCKKLVKVGKNCSIDPSAVIHGPTIIGDNVYIGPGVVIANSLIGNNVNIMQGCQIMLSVISDRCFLPFNSGYFMSSLMENTIVAQNATLQLCVVGRNTFIGANNCFTDFNLHGEPIRTYHQGRLEKVGMPVLGSAIGHECKLGSGFVVYPGRMVGSNTTLILDSAHVNLLHKNINVPGMEPDFNVPGMQPDNDEGDSGETRRTTYRWPYLHDPDSGELRDPNNGIMQHAPSESMNAMGAMHDTGQCGSHAAGQEHTAHEPGSPGSMDELDMTDTSQTETNQTYGHVIHAGG